MTSMLIDIPYPIYAPRAEQERFIRDYFAIDDYQTESKEDRRELDEFFRRSYGGDISHLKK